MPRFFKKEEGKQLEQRTLFCAWFRTPLISFIKLVKLSSSPPKKTYPTKYMHKRALGNTWNQDIQTFNSTQQDNVNTVVHCHKNSLANEVRRRGLFFGHWQGLKQSLSPGRKFDLNQEQGFVGLWQARGQRKTGVFCCALDIIRRYFLFVRAQPSQNNKDHTWPNACSPAFQP